MFSATNRFLAFMIIAVAMVPALSMNRAQAATAEDLDRDASQALEQLYKSNPLAADLSKKAKAVLVFPQILKAGLIFGAGYGEGVLREEGKAPDYYNSFTGSWGLQAGAQSYGYVVLLMTDSAVEYLHKSRGLEIGVGPTVVIVDEGVAKNLSSSTVRDDAYAFIFDQKGLMAGISLEGTKISHITR